MYAGTGVLCFKVSDVQKSIRFYEAIGLTGWSHPSGLAGGVGRGLFGIYLMGFDCKGDWVNFRGADAFEVHARLRRSGIEAPGEPTGTSWMTEDPDGHKILFNTSQGELTPGVRQDRVAELLGGTEQHLVDWDASEECLQAFREHVLARFGSA